MNKLYSFGDMMADVDVLCTNAPKVDYIIGLNRGGCIPAVIVSHKLGIPCVMANYSTRDHPQSNGLDVIADLSRDNVVLIVDDMVDSGVTVNNIIRRCSENVHNLRLAVLLRNTDVQITIPCVAGRTFSRHQFSDFVEFWWES